MHVGFPRLAVVGCVERVVPGVLFAGKSDSDDEEHVDVDMGPMPNTWSKPALRANGVKQGKKKRRAKGVGGDGPHGPITSSLSS